MGDRLGIPGAATLISHNFLNIHASEPIFFDRLGISKYKNNTRNGFLVSKLVDLDVLHLILLHILHYVLHG